MTTLFGNLPTVRTGTQFGQTKAKEWNNLFDAVKALLKISTGTGLTHRVTRAGVQIGLAPQREVAVVAKGVEVRSFYLTSLSRFDVSDVIHGWSLDDAGEPIDATWIAMPPLLRKTPFDGKTFYDISYAYSATQTRLATKGNVTITQVITPPYWMYRKIELGEEIVAVKVDTGITVNTSTEENPILVSVEWQEIASQRVWAVPSS